MFFFHREIISRDNNNVITPDQHLRDWYAIKFIIINNSTDVKYAGTNLPAKPHILYHLQSSRTALSKIVNIFEILPGRLKHDIAIHASKKSEDALRRCV